MRTYKGRTPQEQREFNRERKERAQRIREQKAQGIEVPASEADDFSVNIEAEGIARPQLSFKDRLLSKFQNQDEDEEKPKTKTQKEHSEKSEKLLSHVLPLTLSALLALYSQKLFSDEYKPCAPTKEEVSTIILPIFTIISRHVEIEGRASQDALDMGAIILASITVGTRMLMTAEIIRKGQYEAGNEKHNISEFRGSQKSHYSQADTSTIRSNQSANGTEQHRGESNAGANGNGNAGNDLATDGPSDAEKVAQLFKRDTAGRRQMGLAPRVIRAED